MRKEIWNAATRRLTPGQYLPWWAKALRAALFPLDFFFWHMSSSRGYQQERDVWLIEGVAWNGHALRALANADGQAFRVTRIGNVVHLEKLTSIPPRRSPPGQGMPPARNPGA